MNVGEPIRFVKYEDLKMRNSIEVGKIGNGKGFYQNAPESDHEKI